MVSKFVNLLFSLSQREHSPASRIVSLLFGIIFFLVIVPWIATVFSRIIGAHIGISWPDILEIAVAFISAAFGLLLLAWSTITLLSVGKGTPFPATPTKILIVSGPYRLCRNPIQLGATFYFLGFGTFFENLTVGLVNFLLFLIIGSCYHKFIEEKELLLRFGEEYKRYRESTPFLIPKIGRR